MLIALLNDDDILGSILGFSLFLFLAMMVYYNNHYVLFLGKIVMSIILCMGLKKKEIRVIHLKSN